jgi:hypothetical protein
MNRRITLYLALGGISLAVVALVLLNLPLGLGNGSHAPGGATPGGLLIYVVGVIGGIALSLVALVSALVQTAQWQRWGWFGVLLGEAILTLLLVGLIAFFAPWAFLLCPLTLVVYGFAGPTTPAATRP